MKKNGPAGEDSFTMLLNPSLEKEGATPCPTQVPLPYLRGRIPDHEARRERLPQTITKGRLFPRRPIQRLSADAVPLNGKASPFLRE